MFVVFVCVTKISNDRFILQTWLSPPPQDVIFEFVNIIADFVSYDILSIFFILLMWIQPIMRMTGRSIVKGILMLIFFNFIVNRIGSQSLVIYGKLI